MNAFRSQRNLSPSVFCLGYDPGTGTTESSVYRLGTHNYDCLKTALVEMLAEQHTSAEVEAVFKHFQGEGSPPAAKQFALEMGLPMNAGDLIPPDPSTGRKEKTQMKKNLRGKIRDFVQSEEGKVGVKSPLALGVATGSLLLAQAIVGIPQAEAFRECWDDDDCDIADHECHGAQWPHTKGTCHE